ncbi:MAG: hypothetical protein PHY47_12885 [Lachnospiraceae bacterium]|nr:hypothetical protein [Lachnospiraceae bacterium]
MFKIKGDVRKVLDGVGETTTSDEVDTSMFNALYVACEVGGTGGTWTVKLQGRLNHDGTALDLSDESGDALTTGAITASCIKVFKPIPDIVKLVATENVDGGTITVYVQPTNI